jgi:hypothetical protein
MAKKLILLLGLSLALTGFVRSTFTHTAVTVLTASSTATLVATTSRNYVLLQNVGANNIFCKFGVVAVANEGFRVPATTGVVEFTEAIPTAALNCIAAAADTLLLVTEGRQP